MKILLDMNLSPDWVAVFEGSNISAVHWSTVGDPREKDAVIMEWARTNDYIVFTHDLDFGALLAATGAETPSVIQVRTQDILPNNMEQIVISALNQFESLLESGALLTIDQAQSRVRILPIRRK
jgi:predicted nuclease of predicted toxin-antitoxin system